jgi:hypothetical protein
MPEPFDATLKELIEAFPDDWLRRLGVPAAGPVEVLSPELSTVTAAADLVLRIGGAVVHIEAESGPDPDLATRMLLYNVLIHRQVQLPVHSIVFLLRPTANPGGLSGTIQYAPRPPYGLEFRFEIIRVWEQSAQSHGGMGLGVLPLAVLCKPPQGMTRKEGVIYTLERVVDRIAREAPPDKMNLLVTATVILAGMYLDPREIQDAIQRFPAMIESSAYQVFEEIGAALNLKKTILRLGEVKFGRPTDEQKHKLEAITNLARLERLSVRLLKVDDWDALLKGR